MAAGECRDRSSEMQRVRVKGGFCGILRTLTGKWKSRVPGPAAALFALPSKWLLVCVAIDKKQVAFLSPAAC